MIGTTPTHTFKIPYETILMKEIEITYAQQDSDKPKIRKTMKDCTLERKSIIVRLSQKDTFTLNHKLPVKMQIRCLTNEGEVFKSKVIVKTVDECLSDEVLK